jgi:iron complex outermembrane receptor protein
MRGQKPTNNKQSALRFAMSALAVAGFFATPANAQMEGILEEIVVTAQKREESLQDVPISVATMQGESLNALFSGSEVSWEFGD